jgi:hypothetical protein
MLSKGDLGERHEKEHEIHNRIEKILSEIYAQDINGHLEGIKWVIRVKHGKFLIDIMHPIGKNYIDVAYKFDLDEEPKDLMMRSIGGKVEAREIEHGLRTALTFSNTFYNIHMEKSEGGYNVPCGFSVAISLFPFSGELSIDNLSKAIQNVISASALGISFLGLRLTSVKSFMEFLSELNSSPGEMYQ